MKYRWVIGCLLLVASLSAGWQLFLWQIPTDTLIGNANFQEGQYLLQAEALPNSNWAENGICIYQSILRVDGQNIADWLQHLPYENWQVNTQHQYLVERRDGDGKRVITITLRYPEAVLMQGILALVGAVSYGIVVFVLVWQKSRLSVLIPLLLMACASWLGLGWYLYGIPLSYVALQFPLLGQWLLHGLAQMLFLGALVHIGLLFPNPIVIRRWWIVGLYSLYPLGGLAVLLAQSTMADSWSAFWQWEQQITVALKAVAYILWTTQYRRASVRQRGQLHWWLLGITAYDLVYLVRIFSSQTHLVWLQLGLGVLLPFAYLLAVLERRSWRWALDGAASFVQGITNTLTLALFLCGVGLTASVFFNRNNETELPTMTLGLSLVFALTTVPLANLLREQFDSWFQGTRSAQRALLHEFTGRVSTQITLSKVVQAFEEALEQGVQPAAKIIWLWNEEAQALQQWGAAQTFEILPPDLLERLHRFENFTPVEQIPEWRSIQQYYGVMPLVASGQLVGVCVIGTRLDGRNYSADGLRFLETLARPATLALRNAQLLAQLEDKIQALGQAYQQLIVAQESERARLATELHDETLQQLAHVGLLAGTLRYQLPAAPQLDELQTVVNATERGLRGILRGIHPAVLTDLGLIPALRSWLPQSDSVKIELMVQGFQERLPEAMLELTLYRLCQESINNALKHAHARHIMVKLSWHMDTVTLEIIDDGVGFETATLAAKYRATHGHFGLTNMRERVNALGGQLQIQSQPQHGTIIRAFLPIRYKG